MTFAIDANLDQEARWAGAPLSAAALRRIAAAAPLLAALAPPGAEVELWAPAAIDPARLGALAMRLRAGTPPRPELAWADPTARAVNDRRFALALAGELGVALPGARGVATLAELDAATAAIAGRWVCKAAWTASGRDRGFGDGAPAGETRTYLARLLARGPAVVEPWLERTADLGVCARVDPQGRIIAEPPHALRVDPRGGFAGIALRASIAPEHRAALDRVVAAAGAALARAGYAGPFGVDAFVHRGGLHPLCELNARHTFGHVAHALAARLGTRVLGLRGPPPPGARVLIAPGGDDPFTAWGA
ncbi:MAG TPA: hypothetical protein VLX92_16455 [Kofleriaceae bacterium]|nr:hypothetical protein [Kofleriaceae bacterium]